MKSVVGACYADDGTVGFAGYRYEDERERVRKDRSLRFALEHGILSEDHVLGPDRVTRIDVREVPAGADPRETMREMGWRG